MGKVLSADQVESFIDRGFVRVEQAYPEKQALAAQDYVWSKLQERGVVRNDRATWRPMVHIEEGYDDPVFQACMTDRLCDSVEDLLGVGRCRDLRNAKSLWGWWPVNFSLGADKPWNVPSGGWHWDGIHFRHRVNAPDQGLLLLCMFSKTIPRGGGTLVAEGSHKVVARFLDQHPDGLELNPAIGELNASHPWLRDLTTANPSDTPGVSRIGRFMESVYTDDYGVKLRVVETTADPGDIYLCHPFLYHAASPNHSGIPRFMCNRTTPLTEPMNLSRPNGDYSAVERSIRESLDFSNAA